jgi:hypothetical protein
LPPFSTMATLRIDEMSRVGSPSTRIRSATLPGVTEPRSASTFAYLAPFQVAICSTCDGVRPACTYSSSSRWSANPGVASVPATSGMPARYRRPTNSTHFWYDFS